MQLQKAVPVIVARLYFWLTCEAKPWQSPEKNYYYLLPRLTYEFLEIATLRADAQVLAPLAMMVHDCHSDNRRNLKNNYNIFLLIQLLKADFSRQLRGFTYGLT